MISLSTDRTILRRFQHSDLKNMIRLESDLDVMKFTPYRVPQTVDKTEERLKTLVAKEAERAPLGVWAVELRVTREFVGWFMLLLTDGELPELGFMIVKEQWGKGLAFEVANTLIDYGLNKLKYPGISAVTDHDNAASIHVLKKLGFRKTSSTLRTDKILGRDTEAYYFELRKSC